MNHFRIFLILIACSALVWGADDQDGSGQTEPVEFYEEVVVVAQKRPESIQDVPLIR